MAVATFVWAQNIAFSLSVCFLCCPDKVLLKRKVPSALSNVATRVLGLHKLRTIVIVHQFKTLLNVNTTFSFSNFIILRYCYSFSYYSFSNHPGDLKTLSLCLIEKLKSLSTF